MKIIDKPWGKEEILELNDKYMVKRLTINEGHRTSLHFHPNKMETFIFLEGTTEMTIGDIKTLYTPKSLSLTVIPNTIHRITAITDVVFLECSTPHPDDSSRVEDDYKRTE